MQLYQQRCLLLAILFALVVLALALPAPPAHAFTFSRVVRPALVHTDVPDPTPIQQRIALVPGGMTVSWSTIGSIDQAPAVHFGTAPDALSSIATGITEWYSPSVTYFHHVVLDSLQPRTQYYWQVISPANASFLVFTFVSAPAVGDASRPITISINGDLGLGNSDASVALLTKQVQTTDVFWHIGDLGYPDQHAELNMTFEQASETWLSEMTPIWESRPYMILPGNHESSCNSDKPTCPPGSRNFTSYLERFRMPFAESGSATNMYYSFDFGMVHFISMDTEVDYPGAPEGANTSISAGPFGDQISWMEADLQKATANRAQVPWILVGGHRPYYTADLGNEIKAYRDAFEAMFVKYGVDIVFWGHVHWYERMWPTGPGGVVEQQGYDDPKMPVYMVPASAGNIEGLMGKHPFQPFTAFMDYSHYALGSLTVHNATHASWVLQESATGATLDEFTLYKSRA